MQHEGEPLGRGERVEDDEQGQADRVRDHGLVLGIGLLVDRDDRLREPGADEVLAARPARAQHVQADPPDDGGQPPAEVVDRVGVRAAQPNPRLLHRVVRVAERSEHPVRDRTQMGPVLLEPLCQPIPIVHVTSSLRLPS